MHFVFNVFVIISVSSDNIVPYSLNQILRFGKIVMKKHMQSVHTKIRYSYSVLNVGHSLAMKSSGILKD